MIVSIIVLAVVTLQRLAELVIARCNTAALLARGGVEVGATHYPLVVGLHGAWLAGLWWLGWDRAVSWPWVCTYAVLQGLRMWTLTSIGRRWTTRIIVVPGETLVRRGPYRIFPHPNYAVVVGEIAVLPLVFGLPAFAAIFSALNAAVLWVRIRAENRALRTLAERAT